MKIAIFSDIHDNIWKLSAALEKIQHTEALICCGDLCAPFVVNQLGEGFEGQIHIVFGNNDGDPFRITKNASQYEHLRLHGEFGEVKLEDTHIAITHFPQIARSLAGSDAYNLVCCGHDHQYHVSRKENTTLVNPGEIMGRFGTSTLAIYDAASNEVEKVEI